MSLVPDPVRMNRHASTQQSSCRLLFTPQGSRPLAAAAIAGNVGIDFDPPTKSQVLLLGENGANRVLGSTLSVGVLGAGAGSGVVLQPVIGVQLWLPPGRNATTLSIEFLVHASIGRVGATDASTPARVRLVFSSHVPAGIKLPSRLESMHHIRCPMPPLLRGVWLNAVFDVPAILDDCGRQAAAAQRLRGPGGVGSVVYSVTCIERVTVASNCCKIRRVYALSQGLLQRSKPEQLGDRSSAEEADVDTGQSIALSLPARVMLPTGVPAMVTLIREAAVPPPNEALHLAAHNGASPPVPPARRVGGSVPTPQSAGSRRSGAPSVVVGGALRPHTAARFVFVDPASVNAATTTTATVTTTRPVMSAFSSRPASIEERRERGSLDVVGHHDDDDAVSAPSYDQSGGSRRPPAASSSCLLAAQRESGGDVSRVRASASETASSAGSSWQKDSDAASPCARHASVLCDGGVEVPVAALRRSAEVALSRLSGAISGRGLPPSTHGDHHYDGNKSHGGAGFFVTPGESRMDHHALCDAENEGEPSALLMGDEEDSKVVGDGSSDEVGAGCGGPSRDGEVEEEERFVTVLVTRLSRPHPPAADSGGGTFHSTRYGDCDNGGGGAASPPSPAIQTANHIRWGGNRNVVSGETHHDHDVQSPCVCEQGDENRPTTSSSQHVDETDEVINRSSDAGPPPAPLWVDDAAETFLQPGFPPLKGPASPFFSGTEPNKEEEVVCTTWYGARDKLAPTVVTAHGHGEEEAKFVTHLALASAPPEVHHEPAMHSAAAGTSRAAHQPPPTRLPLGDGDPWAIAPPREASWAGAVPHQQPWRNDAPRFSVPGAHVVQHAMGNKPHDDGGSAASLSGILGLRSQLGRQQPQPPSVGGGDHRPPEPPVDVAASWNDGDQQGDDDRAIDDDEDVGPLPIRELDFSRESLYGGPLVTSATGREAVPLVDAPTSGGPSVFATVGWTSASNGRRGAPDRQPPLLSPRLPSATGARPSSSSPATMASVPRPPRFTFDPALNLYFDTVLNTFVDRLPQS